LPEHSIGPTSSFLCYDKKVDGGLLILHGLENILTPSGPPTQEALDDSVRPEGR
jgi:hypothetical protein